MEFITANGRPAGSVGLGTWHLGENRARESAEIAAIRTGIENGMTLIDSAEMYANGLSEELAGKAVKGYDRGDLYIVSKVYPHNAGRRGINRAIDNSLKRLGTDYLDLYLLHWRGYIPFSETIECMEKLIEQGKIRSWGVSNMDLDDMEELLALPGGEKCMTDQVLYPLGSRGIEYDLLPYLQARSIPVMAYCPLAQAGRLRDGLFANVSVKEIAAAHSATSAQILLAFLLHHPGVIPIPRTGSAAHVAENAGAANIRLTPDEIARLDRAFPAPQHKVPLDVQ
jgi:diketogulonate reductase-like aldo/keto reductase